MGPLWRALICSDCCLTSQIVPDAGLGVALRLLLDGLPDAIEVVLTLSFTHKSYFTR